MNDIEQRWIVPYYLRILHGNYVHDADPLFTIAAKRDAVEITPEIVKTLIAEDDWRPRISASWFAGINRWDEFTECIGNALVASKYAYASQGYCFFLARVASHRSQSILLSFLDTYLPRTDVYYEQDWAMGAAMWIDHQNNTQESKRLTVSSGPWELYANSNPSLSTYMQIDVVRKKFFLLMDYSNEKFV